MKVSELIEELKKYDWETELYIIPANMVEWSPMQTWYFIY